MSYLKLWDGVTVLQDWAQDGTISTQHKPAEWVELFYDLIFASMAVQLSHLVGAAELTWSVWGSVVLYYSMMYSNWVHLVRHQSQYASKDLFWLFLDAIHSMGLLGMIWNFSLGIHEYRIDYFRFWILAKGSLLIMDLKVVWCVQRSRVSKTHQWIVRQLIPTVLFSVAAGMYGDEGDCDKVAALWAAAIFYEHTITWFTMFVPRCLDVMPWNWKDRAACWGPTRELVPINIYHMIERLELIVMIIFGETVLGIGGFGPHHSAKSIVSAMLCYASLISLAMLHFNAQPHGIDRRRDVVLQKTANPDNPLSMCGTKYLKVMCVERGSMCAAAGVKPGWKVSGIDGVMVRTLDELMERLALREAGEEIEVSFTEDVHALRVSSKRGALFGQLNYWIGLAALSFALGVHVHLLGSHADGGSGSEGHGSHGETSPEEHHAPEEHHGGHPPTAHDAALLGQGHGGGTEISDVPLNSAATWLLTCSFSANIALYQAQRLCHNLPRPCLPVWVARGVSVALPVALNAVREHISHVALSGLLAACGLLALLADIYVIGVRHLETGAAAQTGHAHGVHGEGTGHSGGETSGLLTGLSADAAAINDQNAAAFPAAEAAPVSALAEPEVVSALTAKVGNAEEESARARAELEHVQAENACLRRLLKKSQEQLQHCGRRQLSCAPQVPGGRSPRQAVRERQFSAQPSAGMRQGSGMGLSIPDSGQRRGSVPLSENSPLAGMATPSGDATRMPFADCNFGI